MFCTWLPVAQVKEGEDPYEFNSPWHQKLAMRPCPFHRNTTAPTSQHFPTVRIYKDAKPLRVMQLAVLTTSSHDGENAPCWPATDHWSLTTCLASVTRCHLPSSRLRFQTSVFQWLSASSVIISGIGERSVSIDFLARGLHRHTGRMDGRMAATISQISNLLGYKQMQKIS